MGRTRVKSKTTTATQASSSSKAPPAVSALLEKAQSLITQCDYDLAQRFVERALQADQNNPQAREMLGLVLLETGDWDDAKAIFQTLIPPSPTAPSPPPSAAYLYLAQLTAGDDPHLALQHYTAAIDLLHAQLRGKSKAAPAVLDADLARSIVRALVAQVEIWMDPAHDLCMQPDAEGACEALLARALEVDPGNPEALQMLASVRLTQQRPADARAYLEQAWGAWKDLELDDPRVPSLEARLAITRLFIELELFAPALLVLHGVMSTDDQEVEAWYLEGWAFFLMAEKAKASGEPIDGLGWEELAKDARDCLETCRVLHTNQDHPDEPLLAHAEELIQTLEGLGVKASPPDEDAGEGEADEEEWEDDGSDDDVEMS